MFKKVYKYSEESIRKRINDELNSGKTLLKSYNGFKKEIKDIGIREKAMYISRYLNEINMKEDIFPEKIQGKFDKIIRDEEKDVGEKVKSNLRIGSDFSQISIKKMKNSGKWETHKIFGEIEDFEMIGHGSILKDAEEDEYDELIEEADNRIKLINWIRQNKFKGVWIEGGSEF